MNLKLTGVGLRHVKPRPDLHCIRRVHRLVRCSSSLPNCETSAPKAVAATEVHPSGVWQAQQAIRNEAKQHAKTGDTAEALRVLQQGIQEWPDNFHLVLAAAGTTAQQDGSVTTARKLFRHAAQLATDQQAPDACNVFMVGNEAPCFRHAMHRCQYEMTTAILGMPALINLLLHDASEVGCL